MMRRIIWFGLGVVTATIAIVKGRDVAYRFTPPGIVDQVGALGIGWREFRDEFAQGKEAAEKRIVRELFTNNEMKELN